MTQADREGSGLLQRRHQCQACSAKEALQGSAYKAHGPIETGLASWRVLLSGDGSCCEALGPSSCRLPTSDGGSAGGLEWAK